MTFCFFLHTEDSIPFTQLKWLFCELTSFKVEAAETEMDYDILTNKSRFKVIVSQLLPRRPKASQPQVYLAS